MIIKYGVALVLMAGLCWGISGQPEVEFVVPKKKPNQSIAALKDELADQLAQILKQIPSILRLLATTQDESLAALEQYAQGEKNCFWATATRQQLAQALERAEKQCSALEQLQVTLQLILPIVR